MERDRRWRRGALALKQRRHVREAAEAVSVGRQARVEIVEVKDCEIADAAGLSETRLAQRNTERAIRAITCGVD